MSKFVIVSVCALAAFALFAERYPYERYQTIVDRQMFGPLPEGFDPSKPPSEAVRSGSKVEKELTKEQEKIKSAIRFSVINLTPSGETAVGFSDSSNPKEVRHYYLKVGEKRDGWEVKAADPLKASMTIAKGDITLDLELGANSAQGAGNATRTVPAASGAGADGAAGVGRNLGLRRVGGLNGGDAFSSLRARQAEKRKLQAATAAEAEAKAEEAAAAQAKRDEEAAAEKAKQEEERQQQRQQLLQIQEELKKAREARQAQESAEKESAASNTTTEE